MRRKTVPRRLSDILDKRSFAHVATLRQDGMLSVNPVALIWDGEHIRFSSLKTRLKVKNLQADPRLALSIPDPDNINRYLEVRGTATFEDDVDRSFINQIARKYMDTDEYPFDQPGDERVTITVHPTQVSGADIRLLDELEDEASNA